MEIRSPRDIIVDYLEDAIAAEKVFETQLRDFAKDTQKWEVRDLFERHAEETRVQYEVLTARLTALGGAPSGMKRFLAGFFNMTPRLTESAQEEALTQHLMMVYAIENSEIAMYEALWAAASAAGDSETEALARRIQTQERQMADKVWRFIAPASRDAIISWKNGRN